MEYLRLFENHTEYEAFANGDNMLRPNVSHCVAENDVHYNGAETEHDYSQDYLTFVALESGTFTFTPQNNNVISYSTDNGTTWTEGNSIEVNNGDKVLWKGTMSAKNGYGSGKFNSTNNFDVQGNATSLLFGDNFKGQTSLTGKGYAFCRLFDGNTKVISAENLSLPATTLANFCYASMFNGCTSLTTAPELPATTLADYCYHGMFNGCTSLTTAPELPATTLADYCYQYMFNGCTNLIVAPELPATTLTSQCYYEMFSGCTSLATAPELPATTLANSCYSRMFSNCTSLTTAPELPATILTYNCYNGMFYNCENLTTAPDLPATTLASYCYQGMFWNCTNLTDVAIVPNSVKPVSNGYCCGMYVGTNVQQSSDYDGSAWSMNCGSND